jgi:hypothetical protein
VTTPAKKPAKKVARKAPARRVPSAKKPEKPSITIYYDEVENAAEYLFWAPGAPEREWVLERTRLQRLLRRPARVIRIPAGPSIPLFRISTEDGNMYEFGNFQTSHVPKPPAEIHEGH